MFNDKFLRFSNEAEANSILYTTTPAVVVDGVETQAATTQPNYRNIDVLGILYEKAPESLPEDYVPVPMNGYHVNVRVIEGEDISVLEPYSVIPSQPRRIFWS